MLLCFRFHGHECSLTKSCDSALLSKRRKHTEDRERQLSKQGMTVVSTWECEFKEKIRNQPEIKQNLKKFLPEFYLQHPNGLTSDAILKAVQSGKLFGGVEVDIEVSITTPTHTHTHTHT